MKYPIGTKGKLKIRSMSEPHFMNAMITGIQITSDEPKYSRYILNYVHIIRESNIDTYFAPDENWILDKKLECLNEI